MNHQFKILYFFCYFCIVINVFNHCLQNSNKKIFKFKMKKILKNYCIVGYGKHAELKILPVLMDFKMFNYL